MILTLKNNSIGEGEVRIFFSQIHHLFLEFLLRTSVENRSWSFVENHVFFFWIHSSAHFRTKGASNSDRIGEVISKKIENWVVIILLESPEIKLLNIYILVGVFK